MEAFVFYRWLIYCLFLFLIDEHSLIIAVENPAEEHIIIVETKSGKIAGTSRKTETGRDVVSFLGVPFARAPVGEFRFNLPQEAIPWNDTFRANKLSASCVQERDDTQKGFDGIEMWNPNTQISEDCLQLNLWVPKGVQGVTVLVWIHGGGFFSGSGSLDVYNGEILASEEDVIVVNINYRLGLFGFLYLDDDFESAPGNMGLADQQLALQWVKKNIEAFGGDPNKITIFGESAGAAAVSSHLFSEKSWDLFRYAILQSGTIIEPWATVSQDLARNYTRKLSEMVNCWRNSPKETVECLRNVPASKLLANSAIQIPGNNFFDIPFVPVRRDVHFFRGDVVEKIKSGDFKKTSIFLGSMSDESTYFLMYLFPEYFNTTSEGLISKKEYVGAVNNVFQKLPKFLQNAIAFHYDQTLFSSSSKQCLQPNEKSTLYRNILSKTISDYFFVCKLLTTADFLSEYGSRVYMYYFTDRSSSNPWPRWMGAMHGYEIGYEFGTSLKRTDLYSQQEIKFTKDVMRYWVNFAKFGKPSLNPAPDKVDWPNYDKGKQFVELNSRGEKIGSNLYGDDCNYWQEMEQTCPQGKRDN